jgi:hypothetical protein
MAELGLDNPNNKLYKIQYLIHFKMGVITDGLEYMKIRMFKPSKYKINYSKTRLLKIDENNKIPADFNEITPEDFNKIANTKYIFKMTEKMTETNNTTEIKYLGKFSNYSSLRESIKYIQQLDTESYKIKDDDKFYITE